MDRKLAESITVGLITLCKSVFACGVLKATAWRGGVHHSIVIVFDVMSGFYFSNRHVSDKYQTPSKFYGADEASAEWM
ncbi:MAG: hypothetical protein IJP54_09240 [Synergistaceae bacterium]|nr:hypothetical protein [Synergistaceae bacterium]